MTAILYLQDFWTVLLGLGIVAGLVLLVEAAVTRHSDDSEV